jgi:hypothetical protein
MRGLLFALLLCSFSVAQVPGTASGPDVSRGARERGSFYLNGIGHQYIQGVRYTVVAAAIPTMNGKAFGVKLHVFNRGQCSVNLLPEDVTVEDSVSAKHLELFSAAEIVDRVKRQSAWVHVGGMVAGAPSAAGSNNGPYNATGVPTMADLVRELNKESGGSEMMGFAEAPYPTLAVRGSPRATAHTSASCDLGCELRNREIGDGSGPQLPQRSARPEQIEQSEFLANTIPPEGDVEGVLYFSMPKLTDRAPISHNGRKSYLVTVTIPVGDEKFQFAFPPE